MTADREWPFVGREQLATDVLGRLETGGSVILSGAAGLGKTRLAGVLASRLTNKRVVVHRLTASPSSANLPLAPFASFMTSGVASNLVADVLKSLGADGRSGAGDPVLVVDDMHQLDDASAAVLQQVMLSGFVRLLGTRRSSSPLPRAITQWMQEANVGDVEVTPLADDDITGMVESALGGGLDGRSRVLLCTVCAGNPMYARELVEGSIGAGTLQSHSGLWAFSGEMAATPLLEEVVLARLAPLDEDERLALELFAIAGQLPVELVEHIVRPETIERLERKQVVQSTSDSASRSIRLDVAHPLYRELTRARLGPVARRHLYRQLAVASDELRAKRPEGWSSDRSNEAVRAAVWHMRGEVEIAEAALLDAAHDAGEFGETALSAELAEYCYRRSGSIEAALRASWSLAISGNHEEAIEILRHAAERGTTSWVQAAIRLRIAEEYWWTARLEAAHQCLDEAGLPPGPWNDLLEAQRGVFALLDGDLPEALRRCTPLIGHGEAAVQVVASIALANAAIWGDRTDDALAISDRALGLLRGLASGPEHAVGLLGDANPHHAIQLTAMLHGGDVGSAAAIAEAAYASTILQPSVQARAWTAMLCGQAAALRGDLTKSCRYLLESERCWESLQVPGFARWCALALVQSQVSIGLLSDAEATLLRASNYTGDGFGIQQAQEGVSRAWILVAKGELAAAATSLQSTIDRAIDLRQWTRVAEAWHEAARLNVLDRMVGLHAWQRPAARLAAARFDFVNAINSGSPADMEAVSSAFELLGATLYAAEAAATASRAARKAGATKQTVRLEALAGKLLAQCGTVRTPLLVGRRTGLLSGRESEVAHLAARGFSNRQIAEHLVVSERTVENHMYRIFIKLGIDAREQVADALSAS